MATALCFARCDARALRHEGLHSQPVGFDLAAAIRLDLLAARVTM